MTFSAFKYSIINHIALFIIIIPLLFLCACSPTSSPQNKATNNIFRHAQNIYSAPGSNRVTVYFNWGTQSDSITYILSDSLISNLQSHERHIPTPLSRVVALSTTHVAMLQEINEIESIVVVCDYYRISNKRIWQKHRADSLADLGVSMHVNHETLIKTQADAIFKSAFSAHDFKNDKVLHTLNTPLIYTYSWHEQTPLARAEWILFFGMLYNKFELADSIFSAIELEYTRIQERVSAEHTKPLVLSGDMVQDVWYMPGGKSYMASFIKDAGGNYVFSENTETGSVPLNFEYVLQNSRNATYWIGAQAENIKELQEKNPLYATLPVFSSGNCYSYYAQTNEHGGNNYWEQGYVRPDIVLADIVRILHPEILPQHSLVFYKNLE